MQLDDETLVSTLLSTLQESERGTLTIHFHSDTDGEKYKITCEHAPFEIFAAFATFIEKSSTKLED